ncbi:MAG: phosphatidate cytidylyltransferase [Clostridium sp.]|uniref:phosphatidate cytidylyltransferase n=1 Tax=Clostridium sp. TaxID=1506 RepID=UPI003D6CE68D
MKQRVISSIIGIPILIAIIMSKNSAIINGSILILMVIGLIEFYKSFEGFDMKYGAIGIIFSIIYFVSITLNLSSKSGFYIFLFSLFLIFYSIIFYKRDNVKNATVTFISFFYVACMFSFIVQIINMNPYGNTLVFLVFVVAWSADTFACLFGQRFGKHKLTPIVSPKKSVEGFIAGIAGAGIISYLYGLVVLNFTNIHINNFLIICIIAGGIGSILSQFGDLTSSLIKRFNNVKDFGKLIPGHGGVLDRFDSIILTAPFIYYLLILTMK